MSIQGLGNLHLKDKPCFVCHKRTTTWGVCNKCRSARINKPLGKIFDEHEVIVDEHFGYKSKVIP